MKNRFRILTVSLIAVIAVSACAPTATSVPILPTEAVAVPATPTPANMDTTMLVTPSPIVEILPVATSRGPNLEATDPTTVSLASGGLQLIEFFRFT